ncbi:MAG: hypothetical protein ACI32N_06825 [Bulleidia sp.]
MVPTFIGVLLKSAYTYDYLELLYLFTGKYRLLLITAAAGWTAGMIRFGNRKLWLPS